MRPLEWWDQMSPFEKQKLEKLWKIKLRKAKRAKIDGKSGPKPNRDSKKAG